MPGHPRRQQEPQQGEADADADVEDRPVFARVQVEREGHGQHRDGAHERHPAKPHGARGVRRLHGSDRDTRSCRLHQRRSGGFLIGGA